MILVVQFRVWISNLAIRNPLCNSSKRVSDKRYPILDYLHTLTIPKPFAVGPINCYLVEGNELALIDTGAKTDKRLLRSTSNCARVVMRCAIFVESSSPTRIAITLDLPRTSSPYPAREC